MTRATICHVGPTSIHSHRLMEALHLKGYEITMISDAKAWVAPEFGKSISLYVLPTLARTNFATRFIPNSLQVMRILRQVHPDLVHLHAQHHYSMAIAFSGLPFILNSWGTEVLELPAAGLLQRTLAKGAAKKAQKIIVDAQILKDIWVDAGIASQKIEVIPFGVDTRVFNPKVDGNPIRNRFRIEKDDVSIISTRPFYNGHYDIKCLIKAIPHIVEKHSNARFIIKGSGPREEYLKNLVEEMKISRYVSFAGLVSHHELAQYLRAADIYVSTSFVDSTSVSLLEAMACGLAPVVTDIAGNREWIRNGVNGLLFAPRNHEALAERINTLIENEDQRKQFGEENVEAIEKRATWSRCVSKIQAVYEELLQEPSARSG